MAARLVETASGNVLAAFRESAEGPAGIIHAVDRVSKQLRGRVLGELLRATRTAPPLEQVTTGSLEALRAFSQALQATRQGDRDRNLALLEEAIRLDSTFASAHRALGIALANAGQDPRRRVEAIATAYRLRNRLTERERLLAEASYFGLLGNQREREAAAYRRMLEFTPDYFAALNNLALIYQFGGDPRAGASTISAGGIRRGIKHGFRQSRRGAGTSPGRFGGRRFGDAGVERRAAARPRRRPLPGLASPAREAGTTRPPRLLGAVSVASAADSRHGGPESRNNGTRRGLARIRGRLAAANRHAVAAEREGLSRSCRPTSSCPP